MPAVAPILEPPLTLNLDPVVRLDDDELFELCRRNRDLHIERTSQGEIIVMSPAGGKTSDRNSAITAQLWIWAMRDKTGRAFDSSGGFTLPNGAMRAPDAAWVERTRLSSLATDRHEKFLPLCPAFVIELRSPSDSLASVQAKLEEYIDNGARLGWLIDPSERRVHVYRPGFNVEIAEEPSSLNGDPELPGFVMELGEVWDPTW